MKYKFNVITAQEAREMTHSISIKYLESIDKDIRFATHAGNFYIEYCGDVWDRRYRNGNTFLDITKKLIDLGYRITYHGREEERVRISWLD
jgi:hypothetical protein